MKISNIKYVYWVLSVIIVFSCVLMLMIIRSESELLKSSSKNVTSKHGRPALAYGRPDMHLEYFRHSTLINNDVEGESGINNKYCVRPYYHVYVDKGNRERFSTVKPAVDWTGTMCQSAPSTMDVALVQSSDLSYKQVHQSRSSGSLLYMTDADKNNEGILQTDYEVKIRFKKKSYTFKLNAPKDNKKTKNSNSIHTARNCNIKINFSARAFLKDEDNCQGTKNDELFIHINNNKKAEIMRINNDRLELEFFKPINWNLQDISFTDQEKKVTVNCPFTGINNQIQAKFFTQSMKYKKNAYPLTISCKKTIRRIKTETEKLATLFTMYGNNQNIVTTLNKKITNQLDGIAQKQCGKSCDAKIVAMDASSGAIRSIVSHNQDNSNLMSTRKLNDNQIQLDTVKLEIPGSIAKPIFTKAILINSPEVANLKIKEIKKGTINWKGSKRTNHSGQLLNAMACNSQKSCSNKMNGYSVKNNNHVNNLDFNKYMAKSNNVYATSVMFLGNFAHNKTANATSESSLINKLAQTSSNEIKALLKSDNYFKLPDSNISINNKLAPWALEMNKLMRVRFSMPTLRGASSEEKFLNYTPYRTDAWPSHLPKSFLINASPEREFLNYRYCYETGFFACDAYQWIIGGNDSRWSPITLAEQVSSIATNNQVKASFFADRSEGVTRSDVTHANKTLFSAMQGVVKGGTGRYLRASFNKINKNKDLAIIAKTGTPNKVDVQTGKSTGKRIASEIIDKYFSLFSIDYGTLVSQLDPFQINEKGQLMLDKIKNTKEYKHKCNSACKLTFKKQYKKYLKNYLLPNANVSSSTDFNKTFVFSLGHYNQSQTKLTDGCTFYISINFRQSEKDKYMALRIAEKILDSGVAQQCIKL